MAKRKSQAIPNVPPNNKEMRPHIVKGLPPPFYELGAYIFQDFSSEILAQEPGITHSRVFGDQGQTQFGVDVEANNENGKKEVGQCKRYKSFTPKQIIDASDEFLEHWDTHWKSKNVQRFILFVAGSVTKTQSIEEIDRQKERFRQLGLDYDLWDATDIERKLRPHFQIVSKFCHPGDYWVKEICGEHLSHLSPQLPSQNQAEIVVNTILISQLSEFATQFAEKELQELRSLWQEGNEKDALARLDSLKNDAKTWGNATPELKARIICFAASVALETGEETPSVERLLTEAHSYASVVSEKRVRALLFMRAGDLDNALGLLSEENDVDTHNLRAALLLDAGQREAAIDVVSDLIEKGKATAETYRLQALIDLTKGELNTAEQNIKKAKEKESRWFRLQVVEGMIAYYKAISLVAIPHGLVAFPLPIDWILVNQDEASIASLRMAEEIFSRLAENKQRIESKPYFSVWRLACLLNDTERQEEALKLCKSLLEADPASFPAIAWATSRRLDVELQPSIELLEKRISDTNVNINDAIALASLYDYYERFADALHVLETTHDVFEQQQAMEMWTTNYVRLLIRSNDVEEIERVAESLPEGEEYLLARSLIASHRAIHTGSWNEFVTHQLGLFEETQEAEFLLDACMALYRNKQWDEFAKYADSLIESIGTADIYRYVILGTFNAHQYERCLSFISLWNQRFHLAKEQQEFRQVKLSCFHSLGKYDEALSEAKALVEDNPSITNTLNIIHLLYETGNYDAVAVHAESLKEADLHPETLLQLAHLLRGNHTTLAQYFWRKAMDGELPDESVGAALDLAFKLGLDDEVGDLFPRLVSYDKQEKQSIEQFQTREEISRKFEDLRKYNAEFENAYRSGILPIHFYAEHLNLPFSDIFHEELKEKETGSGPLGFRPLYVRYGGRPLIEGFHEPIANLRLYLDISSLLLAEHLGILDDVEKAFAPLYVPSEVFTSLASMVDRTYHHQPSVIEANKTIVKLVSRKKLKVAPPPESSSDIDPEIAQLDEEWIECFELAKARNGYFLTFLPPTKLGKVNITDDVHLTADKLRHLINCRALADALRAKKELTHDEYKDALEKLGNLAQKYPGVPNLTSDVFIVCNDVIADSLARTGLLERACSVFDVYITQRKHEIAQGATSWDKDREEARKWLHGLQQRLRTGIEQRRYIALPIREYESDSDRANTTSGVLLSLINHADSLQESDAVWIADRYSNHFNRVGKAPAIDVVEILKLLVGKQLLTPARYYEILIQLRAGNVRYIPLQQDELLYHLQNALKEEDGKYWVEETRPLKVIAQSLAACIADRKDLQLPPVPEQITHQQGEVEFIFSIHRVIQQTLHEIWGTVANPTARKVLAEWIVENLYLDYPSLILREKEQRPADEPDYYRAGAQLTGFISLAYFQIRTNVEGTDPYQDYVEWVLDRIVGRRLYTEPPLLEAAANVIKHTITSVKQDGLTDSSEDIVDLVLQRYIRTLPDILRAKVESDLTFLEQIGVKEPIPIITVGELHFERDVFWQAAANVVNGGEQRISATNIDAMVRFSPLEEHGQMIVCIDHPQKNERIGLNNLEFGILRSSKEEQENFLKRQRPTFDCSDAEFQRIVSELLGIEDSTQRVLKLLSMWKESAAIGYQDLATDIQRGGQLDLTRLTQFNFDSLRRYLRLTDDANPQTQDLRQRTAQLIQELGVEPAFFRVSGLPCPLPQVLLETLDAMPTSERIEFLKRRLQTAQSIVSVIHIIRLLYRYGADEPTLKETADKILNGLLSEEGKQESEAFVALLMWVHQQFLLRTEFAQYSTQVKIILTWTHAHHLFCMMRAAHFDVGWIKELFTSEASRMSIDILLLDKEYRNDIAHPRFTNYGRMMLTGISYALDDQYGNLAPDIAQRVIDLAFPVYQDDTRFPAIFMFFGTAFLGNVTGTFLNRDIGEEVAALASWERPERFSHEGIAEFAGDLIQQILTDNEQVHFDVWAILSAIIHHIELPEELAQHLSNALNNTNWVSLFTENYNLWRIAFYVAVVQYPWSSNETLKQQLRNAIQRIAITCAEREQTSGLMNESELLETVILLLEGAIRTAVDTGSGEIALETFGNTVIDIAWRWEHSRIICTKMIRMMSEDLPLPYAQQLWATLATLRAM